MCDNPLVFYEFIKADRVSVCRGELVCYVWQCCMCIVMIQSALGARVQGAVPMHQSIAPSVHATQVRSAIKRTWLALLALRSWVLTQVGASVRALR